MESKLFEQLLKSVHEADKILRGEKRPSRIFKLRDIPSSKDN